MLNGTTRWKDVPEPVWKYTLGSYQVLKKWLATGYREASLLGRALTAKQWGLHRNVRRIAAILALSPELDIILPDLRGSACNRRTRAT
ncbi:MAG: type ISP restriction/modification enzyme [Verrucomicrobiales bacterium]